MAEIPAILLAPAFVFGFLVGGWIVAWLITWDRQ